MRETTFEAKICGLIASSGLAPSPSNTADAAALTAAVDCE